jgi:hypothetical protein
MRGRPAEKRCAANCSLRWIRVSMVDMVLLLSMDG